MKILKIITALGIGGAELLLADVCSVLSAEHEVTIIYLKNLTALKPRIESFGIRTIFIDLDKNGFLSSVFKIKKIIKNDGYDIVHTHLPAADTIGRLAAILAGKTTVFSSIHSMDEWKDERRFAFTLLKIFNRFTVNRFKRVFLIAVSECVKNFCVDAERISPKKIFVILNFCNYDISAKTSPDFNPATFKKDGIFTMLSVGRLEKLKGHIFLLRAMNELVNRRGHKNISLTMIGDGHMKDKYLDYVFSQNLTNYVSIKGFEKNVFDYMKHADLFVSTSIREGFGIAILEACYWKIPILASDIDVTTEILTDNESGILFKCEQYMDLADKIELFINKEFDVEHLTKNAHEVSLSLSKEKHIKKLLELYEQACLNRPH